MPTVQLHLRAKRRIVCLGQDLLAVSERILHGLGQHVFGIAFTQFQLTRRLTGDARTKRVIGFRDVNDKVREGHLRRRRTVAVLVGGHFVGGAEKVFRLPFFQLPHGADHRIGRVLSWRLGLRDRDGRERQYQDCNGYAFHVSPTSRRLGKHTSFKSLPRKMLRCGVVSRPRGAASSAAIRAPPARHRYV